ncbi:MAG: phosphonate utilization associated transcriptional regulator [Rhodoferax sp.]|nr:phosphonate utilization associated transcriptional regulator [Rhodoferax sp.]
MSTALHSTIALLQSSSLTSLVQQEIERAILVGEYPPGAKLNEAVLAEKLGVSRGPVREAFRMLDEAGLVRTEKNRGVFVRTIPISEALEIFDLRAAMDEWVGKRLAASISDAHFKEIKAMVAEMEKAVKAQDAQQYHVLNLKFHDRMVEMSGNRKLTETYRKLIKELSLFRRQNLADSKLMRTFLEEHKQIVKAIGSGDGQAAAQAMHDHVMQSRQRTIDNDRRQQLESQAATQPSSPGSESSESGE